tara:strand:- start:8742 stop:8963 length:222 start_codon:yes stop_codon:yes gene_type:complete
LVLPVFIFQFVFAQEIPIDFSVASHAFTGFGGSGFPFRSAPDEGSNTVGEFFNNGANSWQSFAIYIYSNQGKL